MFVRESATHCSKTIKCSHGVDHHGCPAEVAAADFVFVFCIAYQGGSHGRYFCTPKIAQFELNSATFANTRGSENQNTCKDWYDAQTVKIRAVIFGANQRPLRPVAFAKKNKERQCFDRKRNSLWSCSRSLSRAKCTKLFLTSFGKIIEPVLLKNVVLILKVL